jgi:hypothetical protein
MEGGDATQPSRALGLVERHARAERRPAPVYEVVRVWSNVSEEASSEGSLDMSKKKQGTHPVEYTPPSLSDTSI